MKEQNLTPWNLRIKSIMDTLHSFKNDNTCYTFMVDDNLVGYIRVDILAILKQNNRNNIFNFDDANKCVTFNSHFNDFKKRTDVLHNFLTEMRDCQFFPSLNGWRNEHYDVKRVFNEISLFEIERSAVCIFGVISYGCHINGYIKDGDEYKMWISRRSKTKQTYPGLLDNFSAGGLTSGLGLIECAKKELQEECGLDDSDILKGLKQVDAITYAYENNEGIYRECEFIFDLKLPNNFKPHNTDGEVGEFYLMTINEVKEALDINDFKPNSAFITLNFLMRKGLINADTEANYLTILEKMHTFGF